MRVAEGDVADGGGDAVGGFFVSDLSHVDGAGGGEMGERWGR